MAPSTRLAGYPDKDLKENRVPSGTTGKLSDRKDVAAPVRRTLGERGNAQGVSAEKPTSARSPPSASSQRLAATTSRPMTPQRGTTTSTSTARPRTVATTSAVQKKRIADPWADVRAATEEADKLEAELARLTAEFQQAEAEALEAEAAEKEAENALTTKSAEMLDEYRVAHECCMKLEAELKTARQKLESRRKENLELSRRNIELDREMKICKEQVDEARDLLEQCTRSQGSLDAEISERLAACERQREAARVQCERLAGDLKRFSTMKERLLELSTPSSSGEVKQLISEAEVMIEKTKVVLAECEEVARKGIVPPEPVLEINEKKEELEEEARDSSEIDQDPEEPEPEGEQRETN